jgi:hypothetical protein
MIAIIFGVLGLVVGFFVGFFIKSIRSPKTMDVSYIKRGLYIKSYEVTNTYGSYDIDVTFEVGEVDYTDTLSKVKVISFKTNKSEYNQGPQGKLVSMIDNSWIISSDIKWIKSTTKDRDDKINQILHK